MGVNWRLIGQEHSGCSRFSQQEIDKCEIIDRVTDYNENLVEGEEPITYEEMLAIMTE